MGRPVYPHELNDPDFTWLLNSFRESNPHCVVVDSPCMPVVIFREGSPLLDAAEVEKPEVPAAFEADEAEDVDGEISGHK